MALDSTALQRVAHLARLQLDQQDIGELTGRLNDILAMVDQLQQAQVADLAPLSHPLEISQPLREDQASNIDWRERVMALAPASEAGCYLVPRVIE